MDLHHKLRRDPNWDPRGCNLCGEVGHQAAMCPNGTVNWKAIYGEEAFILKPPVYESELRARRQRKEVNVDDLEKRAQEFAKQQAAQQGLDWEQVMQQAAISASTVIQPAELPPGWAIAHDAAGKAYFWHKKTQKTTWERPTADTPIN